MSGRSDSRMRVLITREAARLMYEEQVAQYFTAKRMAARRLLGRGGATSIGDRSRDLPSNGEIQDAFRDLVDRVEGDASRRRLVRMREVALQAMRLLEQFEPRLIGSVATGHVHRTSDIDIQLFTDDSDAPERFFRERGWPYERDDVVIRRGNGFHEYQHIRLDAEFPIELTIYPRRDLRARSRSSTDGRPMVRLTSARVRDLLEPPPQS